MPDFPSPSEMEHRLALHLRHWLGSWPPRSDFEIVESPLRVQPGWDGQLHRVIGVASPAGAILSVPPGVAAEIGTTRDAAARNLGKAIGAPLGQLIEGTFRWSVHPGPPSDEGEWLQADDPRLPPWLVPFGSPVLASLDENGRYMAGVGIKRHDRFGQELAVGTDPRYRGRGLARLLVARAARTIVDGGAVATYLHDDDNGASARVADAAGFPDMGWRILGFWEV